MRVIKVIVRQLVLPTYTKRRSVAGFAVEMQDVVPTFEVYVDGEMPLDEMHERANHYGCGAGRDHDGNVVMIPEDIAAKHDITTAEAAARFVLATVLKDAA